MQVPIPDILPQDVPGICGLLSMVAGDFVEVYGQPGYSSKFDAVATCFFLDTAHNLFEYIDVIWNTLKARDPARTGSSVVAVCLASLAMLSVAVCMSAMLQAVRTAELDLSLAYSILVLCIRTLLTVVLHAQAQLLP